MRFMLLQHHGEPESGQPVLTEWAEEDVQAHIRFQQDFNEELTASGELVEAHALDWPDAAKVVVADGRSTPVVTDGPFLESKELLAGFRIVEVDSLDRAIEIAARASAAPGMEGQPLRDQIEVRQVMGEGEIEL
jgi:hypothetical protein